MLSAIRSLAKSWVAQIVITILILSFAVWGIKDAFHGAPGTAVIEAGDRSISEQDFKSQFDQQKKAFEARSGQTLSYDDLVKRGAHVQALQQMSIATTLGAWTERYLLRPSKTAVANYLGQIQSIIDPLTGKVDKTKYADLLSQNGFASPESFEQRIADQLAVEELVAGSFQGLKSPEIVAALQGAAATESRSASWFALPAAAIPQPGEPTDADIKRFYDQNRERMMQPEMRFVTLVRFTAKQVPQDVKVNEADVQKQFDFKKDSLSTPERRSFVEIPVKSSDEGQKVLSALKSGQAPDAAAKLVGAKAIVYDGKPKTILPDPKVADAVFSAKPGDVVGPVQGTLSTVVIKVNAIIPGHQETLEEARPQIEADLKQRALANEVNSLVQAFEAARKSGASVEDAAHKVGLTAEHIGPLTADGQLAGHPAPPQLAQTAFALPQGGQSDVEEIGPNQSFALKVDSIQKAGPIPLETVKAQIITAIKGRAVADATSSLLDKLAARLRKGDAIDAVAGSVGAKVQKLNNVDRLSAQPQDQALLPLVFSTGKGDVFSGPVQQAQQPNQPAAAPVYVVGKVEQITQAPADAAAHVAVRIQAKLDQGLAGDLQELALKSMQSEVKVKTYPDRASAALGVTAPEPGDKLKK